MNKVLRLERLLPTFPALAVLIGLESMVGTGFLPSYLVPAPSSVLEVLASNSGGVWLSFAETFISASFGFVLSILIGISIGIFLSSFYWAERAFLPYAVFFQTVPIIAIAPLLVIWIGYGKETVIASASIVSVFPMIASTLSGFQSTDPAHRELFQIYGASRWDRLCKLEFPSALPQIFVGLRIAAGLAVIGAIVGEFIAGGGLGGLIDVARTRQRVDQVFAAILLASLVGLVLVQAVAFFRNLSLSSWHGSLVKKKKRRG